MVSILGEKQKQRFDIQQQLNIPEYSKNTKKKGDLFTLQRRIQLGWRAFTKNRRDGDLVDCDVLTKLKCFFLIQRKFLLTVSHNNFLSRSTSTMVLLAGDPILIHSYIEMTEI